MNEGGVWTVWWPAGDGGDLQAVVVQDGEAGRLKLAVYRNGSVVLEPSPLGIITKGADLSTGLQFVGRKDRTVTESYTMATGKQSQRRSQMAEATFSFADGDGARIDIVVRVARDGVAYRYVLPEEKAVTVTGEASAFVFPEQATAWLSPYRANYEGMYGVTTAAAAPAGEFAYPALFRIGETYVLLSETDVDGRYCGSRLAHEPGTGRYQLTLADSEVRTTGALATPWRVIIVGDLAAVTESTLTDDLAPPSRIADTSWIRPGRVAWSWLNDRESPKDFQRQKEYVDYAAARGWEYVLVDEGWKAFDWAPELVQYGKDRGVGILLWVRWTDVETESQAEALFDRVKAWGVAGLKIDFMDSDARERYRWYDMVLRTTAERRLLVNFHGSTIPHGIQRTWPHVMTMEGVRGGEYALWSTIPPEHVATLVFTRNVVGSMDYTPLGLIQGLSDGAELALSVLFESGQQHFGGAIEKYRERPRLERFLEQVPAAWDETRLLWGYPGAGLVLARRRGERWFLGGLAATPLPPVKVSLGFLKGAWRVEIIRDGEGGLVSETHRLDSAGEDADSGRCLTVPLNPGSGFAGVATPLK